MKMFERKLRKEVRESSIKRGDDIYIIDTRDNNYFVLNDFLRNKIGLPLKFSDKGKRVYSSSLEEKGRDLLSVFFEGDNNKDKNVNNVKGKDKVINLLVSFTQHEIDQEASYLGFEGKSREGDEIVDMINRLDAKFKNIKTGLSKSSDTIRKALEER